MATNTRSYFPSQALFAKKSNSADAYTFVHGVQSASDSASLPKQDINEFGQLNVFERIEDTPEISVDVERVLDGNVPLYLLASKGSTLASLTGRQNSESVLALGIYSDTNDYVGQGSSDPIKVVEYSGVQVNSLTYSFSTDGPFTESINFVGNYMEWTDDGTAKYGTLPADPTSAGTDEPLAYTNCLGGVQFKESLVFDSGETYQTLLPTQIDGVTAGGFNPLVSGGCPQVNVQSIEVSVDLSRERIPSLGCRGDYAKLAQFPTDVTVNIEVLMQDGHGIGITEEGANVSGCHKENSPNQRFRLVTKSGLVIDCGTRLKLDDVSQTFGDTGGSNGTVSYTFVGKSIMSVFHTEDPSSIVYAGSA